MASLLSWAEKKIKGGVQTVKRDIVNPVVHQTQAVVAQANPLDNGRTFSTVNRQGASFAPAPQRSAFQQATHNGFTNVAGGIAKPIIRTSMALNQGIGNAELALGGRPTQNANQFFGKNYLGAQKLTGYTGTKRQIAGDVANTTITVGAPGVDKVIQKSFESVAPKVIPKVIPNVVARAGSGAIVGAPMNVASYVASNEPITKKGVTQSFKQGAQAGAVLGAVGAAGEHVAPAVVKQIKSIPRNQRLIAAQGAAESKPLARIPVNKLTPTDVSGYGQLDPAQVQKYRQQIQTTGRLDPILAMRGENGKLFVEDGKHRLAAAKAEGLQSLPGKIVTPQDIRQRAQGGYVAIPGKRGASLDNGAINTPTQAPASGLPAQMPSSTLDRQVSSNTSLLPNAEQRVFAQNPMSPTTVSGLSDYGTSLRESSPQKIASPAELQQSKIPQANVPSTNSLPNDTPLPIHNTKQVGNLDKAFRSTRSIIERQGEHGKALANLLQKTRDTEEIYQAQLQKALPTVRSLKGKAFTDFVEATQGNIAPPNPTIAKAVQEWQSVHPQIRQRAVNAGLDVGNLGPNYYPHFIDYEKVFKDTNTYNKAINHLVATGQAANQEDAIKLLNYAKDVSRNRQFGNLESSRIIDLPMYDKTPESLASYIRGSTKRIATTENLGAQDQNALKLITKAGQQGYDTEAMKNAYDVAVGAKKYGSSATKFSNALRKYQSTTRLGLGALTNVTQNVNTGIVTGHLRTMGAMLKQFSPKTRSFVEDTGTIADAVLNDLKTESGFIGKGLSKITAPGFATVEKFNRSVSATAGRDYALRLAQKGDETTLRKLGVTGEIKDRTLTPEQQVQAARKIVEKTQFKVDPQDLPGWADSPGGKLVSQFRTFSYAQGKFFSNEILKPAAKGNLLPLGRLLAALPVGYAMYELKRKIAGRPEEPSKTRRGIEAFGNVGGAGLAVDIFRGLVPLNGKYLTPDRFTSMAAGTLGGPTLGGAVDASGAAVQAIQKKNLPSDKKDLAGKAAIVKGNGYYDATTAARFGLRQIPVVGTAIQNRVLPYAPKSTLTKDQQQQYDALPQADKAAFKKRSEQLNIEKKASTKAKTIASFKNDTTGLSAVDALAVKKKQQEAALKNTLSSEDYKLSKLGKADRQRLIKEGKYTAAKFKGLDNYVEQQKQKLGIPNSNGVDVNPSLDKSYKDTLTKYSSNADRTKAFNKDNAAEYNYNYAKFQNDVANGTLTTAQRITTANKLKEEKVGSNYSKNIRDLYGLTKAELNDYLTSDPNGKAQYDQLKAYDQALVAAGIKKTAKFKYGLESKSSSRGGRGTSKGNTFLAGLKYNLAIAPPKAPAVPKPGKLAAPGKTALKKFTPKKAAISKGGKISVHKGTA